MDQISFDDYYEDLQISPNANLDTIERVYRLLAKRYHPDNNESGSVEKFLLITTAYKVLSDPEKRAAYDVTYREAKGRLYEAISEESASQGYENENHIRHVILSILYIERKQDPSKAGIGVWRLEQLLGWPEKVLEFNIWYLKEKGWIERTDTGGVAITACGVDEIENEGLIFDKDHFFAETTIVSEEDENVKLIERIDSGMEIKFERAIEKLYQKIHSDPDNLRAWAFLAFLNKRLGNINEAEKAAKQILNIDPEFSAFNFVQTIGFKTKETQKRFYDYLVSAGLN